MWIWFGFACAKEKESLIREEKPSHIVQVGDLNEFRQWLGDMFCKAYELYARISSDIEMSTPRQEDSYVAVRNNSKWMDLLSFVKRQIEEARKINPLTSCIKVFCGKDYYQILDELCVDSNELTVMGTKIIFEKIDKDGIYREAVIENA